MRRDTCIYIRPAKVIPIINLSSITRCDVNDPATRKDLAYLSISWCGDWRSCKWSQHEGAALAATYTDDGDKDAAPRPARNNGLEKEGVFE